MTYLHHDQAGSTRLLTSSTGTKEASFTYDAYGNATGHTGTATTALGYDAQYTSSDTGLIYLRARVYDSATAQFLTVDPVVPFTRAPYNYAQDNPLNFTDAAGLEAIPLPAPVAGGCAVAPEICGAAAAGGVDAWLGIKVFNTWAGEESGNDEGEAELHAKKLKEKTAETRHSHPAKAGCGRATESQEAKEDRGLTKRPENICTRISNQARTDHITTIAARTARDTGSTRMAGSNRSGHD